MTSFNHDWDAHMDALSDAGLPAEHISTGGGLHALTIKLPHGYALLTDGYGDLEIAGRYADGSITAPPSDGPLRWLVGIYNEDGDSQGWSLDNADAPHMTATPAQLV